MTVRVLVVRPEPGATATAESLRQAGYEPVLLPLTEIRAVSPEPALPRGRFDAVAVTSVNALRHMPARMLDALHEVPLHAVGEVTALAAQEAGFACVEASGGDAAALTRLVVERLPAGGRVAYPCGRVRRSTLEAGLAAAGIELVAIEVYDTVAIAPENDVVARLAAAGCVDAVLIHSAESAAALVRLRSDADASRLVGGARHAAISARAAEPLDAAGMGPILVADEPTEAALLAALRRAVEAD